jgi:hypothetical protein
MKFYTRVYRAEKEVMIAACDKNLCGKTFEEGDLVLQVEKSFYGGELKGKEEVRSLLAEATIANLVGKDIVELAIREGVIDSKNVLMVKGIPHAQMVRM